MVAVEWFSTIAAESLSGVAFLYDYVQLHFNLDPLLNIYTPVTVVVDGASHVSGDIGFANALIGQIDKPVSHVSVEAGACVAIHFQDTSVIAFSTQRAKPGREAFTLFTENGVYAE